MPTFVLNDENVVNSYNFRVRNAGIDFTRFDVNPVMLDSHQNMTESVMGKWKNRRIDGVQLLMDTDFDEALDAAKRLSGQVDRQFVKGASMGLAISFDEDSFERQPDGIWDLVSCEMMEGSICGVPSNSGSLCLYDKATGEPIAEDRLKLSLTKLSANKKFKNPNNPTMEKIILTPSALSALLGVGVKSGDEAAEISRGIEKLQADLSAEKAIAVDLQAKLDKQIKLQAEGLVDAAVLDEKILAADRDEYVQLAIANYALAAKQIARLKGKKSLADQVLGVEGAGTIKSVDEFEKLTEEKKLAFKTGNPEEYRKLFAA